ncbi:MotA/TolQ/ExbB proton channel family protein [Acidihalobacter ferrooxydans]|uniref:MotA/TolQ/ExbB proton channel domain-containing protein n=1 Tax=Acidihalobacter ferrooxydans TaxID=1765967 RepID=A0A1P8UDS3_9GAMM|nr:MotA/TolQ/ExbB proton channel family protein [Acidihalobacter ferrooxydans]APZ41938.1 hypothetical protein BW247_01530 [Acidihalobacter ferrooxydans]
MTAAGVYALFSLSGGILVLLALMLLLALAVIIERGWYFSYAARAAGPESAAAPDAERAALSAYAERRAGAPEGEFARFALTQLDTPPDVLTQSLEQRVLATLPNLDRGLWILDTTVTLAPLFGLLGSIIGMIHTFNLLGGRAAGIGAAGATSGIANALIATGAGLLVAIIAVIGLNIYNNRVREIVRRMDTVKLAALTIARREQQPPAETTSPHVVNATRTVHAN